MTVSILTAHQLVVVLSNLDLSHRAALTRCHLNRLLQVHLRGLRQTPFTVSAPDDHQRCSVRTGSLPKAGPPVAVRHLQPVSLMNQNAPNALQPMISLHTSQNPLQQKTSNQWTHRQVAVPEHQPGVLGVQPSVP